MVLPCLVLSAGASRRMGVDKAWLRLGSESFLARILRTAREAGAAPLLVVHGPALRYSARIPSLGALPVLNPEPGRGRTGSLQRGLAALPPAAPGFLLWPVDMPLVRARTVQALLGAAAEAPQRLVQPAWRGRLGHPLVVPARAFASLAAADPDVPLRALLRELPRRVLSTSDRGVRANINTPAAYDAARLDVSR